MSYFERQVELLQAALTGLLEAEGEKAGREEMLELLKLQREELEDRFIVLRDDISFEALDAWRALRMYEYAAAELYLRLKGAAQLPALPRLAPRGAGRKGGEKA